MSREPISEKSKVTLSLLIIIIGAVAWLTNVAANTMENSKNLSELKGYIYSELLRINNKLDYILEKLPRN